jgi:hypothetical protein
VQQETHVVGGADGFHFAAQSLEPTADDETFLLEGQEGASDLLHRDTQGCSQRGSRDRTQTLQTAAKHFAQCVASAVGSLLARRGRNAGIHRRIWKQQLQFLKTLGRDPQFPPGRDPQLGGTIRYCELVAQTPRARIIAAALLRLVYLGNAKKTEHHQRVVQFVRAAHLGPRLLADFVDGRFVQAAEIRGIRGLHEAAGLHRHDAAFFRRRIIEKRVGTRIQDLLGER